VVEPYGGEHGDRVQVSGPDLRLNPRCTVMLSVVLHELATNAAKYGALSDGAGKVSIDWTSDGRELKLTWREAEGPPVTPMEQRGFGSRLIEQAFKHQLGGRAQIEFQPSGIVCTLECPLDGRQ
jgi:two-component sensor histidine kinase